MAAIRKIGAVLATVFLLCTACSEPEANHEDAAPDLTLIIPGISSARYAAQDAIVDLPGVDGLTASYSEQIRVLDIWVHYEPVPDRWPIHEQIELAVQAATRDYAAHRDITVNIELVDYPAGQPESPAA